FLAEVQRAVARRAARAGRVAEHLRRVLARQLRPARRLAQRPAPRAHRDPGVTPDRDALDAHHQRVAAIRTFQITRTPDGVGERRRPVEAGAAARDRQVGRRLEVAGARVPGLDLETLAGPHAQERLVAPVERVLAGLVAGDALHGLTPRWIAHGTDRP